MHGLPWIVLLTAAVTWNSLAAANQVAEPDQDVDHSFNVNTTQLVEDRFAFMSAAGISAKIHEVDVTGASFIKLHFSQFNIPDGVVVEVSNRDGSESYRYSNYKRDSLTFNSRLGDDGKSSFSAMSISGGVAIVRVFGKINRFDPKLHRLEIDSYLVGAPLNAVGPASALMEKDAGKGSKIENSCGSNERYDATCYKSSHPAEYDRSIPVTKLITSTGEVCTAWRVGPDNRLFTAQHCISDQSDLDGSEIWFNYVNNSCGENDPRDEIKVTGGDLLASDWALDYALFTVNDFSDISYFGYIGLDVRNGAQGEGIFIPQHGLGKPRQIAFESDMNQSGYCEIDDPDFYGFEPGSDIGYFCDTTTSSSGSPVISSVTGRAIALHHLGGCFNSGVKVSLIWPQVSGFFGGVVPDGDIPWFQDPGNQIPTADIEVNCDSLSCSFDASGSSDSDGTIVGYQWDLGDGASSSGVSFEHEFAEAGDYQVTLVVEDDAGATDSDSASLSLSLPNIDPSATFSVSCVDNSCEFNAANSSDPDGSIVAWNWHMGDGNSATGQVVAHEYAHSGTYSITLTVHDDDYASDNTTHTITVSLPNESPEAEFSVSCDGLACVADAGASVDPDGEITGYSWNCGDGQSGSGAFLEHSYAESGTFTITLTVEDDNGAGDSTSQTVTVEAPNQEPEADFSYSCGELDCVFDASASIDFDGELTAYGWTFGDGFSSSGTVVTHTFEEGGSYTVTLAIEDNHGASDSRSRTVSVSPGQSNAAPQASFSSDCHENRCVFDAGASVDSDGQIVTYRWYFGDGSDANGKVVEHVYSEEGKFYVTLIVVDEKGASDNRKRSVLATLPNDDPVANFTVSCEDRQCTLDAGSSKDSDGSIANYDWAFGDGSTDRGQTVTHDYQEDGVYAVTLKVTDSGQASDSRTQIIEIKTEPEFELYASGSLHNKISMAILTWSGTDVDTVHVHRDGKLMMRTANTGKYKDKMVKSFRKSAVYRLCEPATGRCSNEVEVKFGSWRVPVLIRGDKKTAAE